MTELLKRASWLRRKFELWLMHRYMLRQGPVMLRRQGYWWFIDHYEQTWRIDYTGQREIPFSFTLVDRGR